MSVIFSALILIAFVVAGIGAWLATRRAAVNEVSDHLLAEANDISSIAVQRGLPAAAAAVAERNRRYSTLIYRLDDASGALLAGDNRIPNARIGTFFADLPDPANAPVRGDHAVITTTLPNGARLSIAEDIERSERIRDAVLVTLLWVGGMSAGCGILSGLVITRRTLSRMGMLSQTARAASTGDLSVRARTRRTRSPDDIDELTATFNEMLNRIDELVRGIRRVSTDVAHDLRTPLAHLRQKLESAAKPDAAPSDRAAALEDAQSKIDDILRSFDAMLRLADIEAGAMKSSFARVDLGALAERVSDAYRPDIEASGKALCLEILPRVMVRGEKQLLSQALANLLENAMRYTPTSTTVTVEVLRGAELSILAVRDNGPGIPSADRERVLRPFERLDESRSTPGSGLGLSIVAATAKLHAATLQLEDEQPGLRVVLAFPAS